MNNFHIQYDGYRWNIAADGADQTFGAYDTKPEAVEEALEILKAHTGTLMIHGTDGLIEETREFPGHSPPGD